MSNEAATPDGLRKVGAVEDTLRSDRIAQTESGCFTDEGAAAYLGGALDDTMRDSMRTHLDGCDACRALVLYGARAMGSNIDASGETAPFPKDGEPPHRIGRFTILNLLGSGGMGVVYAAFDAQLDRKVALKLVRTELRDTQPDATRNAMLREAKAMAKVDHPNVITVFEVGTHEDQIYVAMELVTGGDLRAWLKSSRGWRDTLAVCRQAGAGLAAAHRAGLVHRDFKPDNVLVGSDNRVRVTDFGLARAVDDRTRPSFGAGVIPAMRPSEHRLTRTGAIVGTPAYMAPEQHRGEPADARSDQFAYCVTVWEALFGQRPFAGDNYAEIVTNVSAGTLRDPPPQTEVPQRVLEALRRGMHELPAERWDDIDDLIAELEVETPRKRKLLVLAAVPLVLAAGVGVYLYAKDKPVEASCPTAESKLAGVWDKKRREETRRAIAEVAPFGADVASRMTSALDVYTEKWAKSWNAACAANARGEQSPTMFDLRVACLTRRLHAVDAILSAFAKREPEIVAKAGELVDGLAQIELCNNTESLARAAPPPNLLLDVAAIDDILEKADRNRFEGNMLEARKLAEQALAAAERIKYRPSAAMALQTIARIEHEGGDYAGAEKTMQRAATEAISSSYDELVADILIELADLVGYELARPSEAYRLVEIARGAIQRIGNPPLKRFELLTTQSRIALAEGKHDPAIAALDEAEQIVNQLADEKQLITIFAARHLIALDKGHFDEAFTLVEREIELRAKYEGARHPNYASALESRATVHFARNSFEKGLADLTEARRVKIEALGPDTPELLSIENNTGIIAGFLGDWEEALRSARVCRAISEKQSGLEHPATALSISNEAAALRELGRLAEAEPLALQALEIRKRTLGEGHADYAVSLTELGELRLAQKRWKDAAKLFGDAEQVLVASIGVESPLIPYATWGLGVAQLELGDAKAAKATLEPTLVRLDELELDPILNSETRLALADALWKLGDKARAQKLVTETSIPLGKLPKGTNKVLRGRIDAWLEQHR